MHAIFRCWPQPFLRIILGLMIAVLSAGCGYDDGDTTQPNPEGACCLGDGSCEIRSNSDCAGEGEDYQGNASLCNPNSCPQPLGACCDLGAECSLVTAEVCEQSAGTFKGEGTLCDLDPCTALCVIGPVGEGVRPLLSASETSLHCACLTEILFLMNADRSYEAALAWSGSGMSGTYGSFAEPFETPDDRAGSPCLVILNLADNGNAVESSFDIIFWADNDGEPGEVLGMVESDPLGFIAPWPSISQRTQEIFEIKPIGIQGKFWAGIRGVWDPELCSIMMVADLSGSPDIGQRRAMTNIAPGLGYSKGWQPVEVIFGQPASIGIGVVVGWCEVP